MQGSKFPKITAKSEPSASFMFNDGSNDPKRKSRPLPIPSFRSIFRSNCHGPNNYIQFQTWEVPFQKFSIVWYVLTGPLWVAGVLEAPAVRGAVEIHVGRLFIIFHVGSYGPGKLRTSFSLLLCTTDV